MEKVNAADFVSRASAYLGVPYADMDCQALVERMLQDAGVRRDWKGSNAMYRAMRWTGTPETCAAVFGRVPQGALLFIHAMDGGEIARGYRDHLGNASHVGVYTAEGKGAVHSSQSRGCVAESAFAGKSIPGGWNMVGLCREVDYGEEIERKLTQLEKSDEGGTMMTPSNAAIVADNGKPVNFRKQAAKHCSVWARLDVGTRVTALGRQGEWVRVSYGGHEGYVHRDYIALDSEDAGEAPQQPSVDVEARLSQVEARLDTLEKALLAGGEEA